jgi:N utilization substance protein B
VSSTRENRRQARVQAAQQVYACEMRGVLVAREEKETRTILDGTEPSPFATELVSGTLERLPEIDRLLASALQNWDLRRLGAVDRAILRVAVAEMLTRHDIPAAVTINEAIEIARSLATAESARFANGVLDRVRQEIGRDARGVS